MLGLEANVYCPYSYLMVINNAISLSISVNSSFLVNVCLIFCSSHLNFNFVVYSPKDIFWSVLSRMLSTLSVNTQLKKE